MKFVKMLNIQRKFTNKIFNSNASIGILKDLIIHLSVELYEVLQEFNWKMHSNSKILFSLDERTKHNVMMELVDVYKYFLNFIIVCKIDSEQFIKFFMYKSNLVDHIYETEKAIRNDKSNFILVDFDDTIGFSTMFMMQEFNKKYKTKYSEYDDIRRHEKYNEFKHQMRIGNAKLYIKPNKKVIDFIKEYVRINKCKLVIFTARPVRTYPNQLEVLQKWLKLNDVKYDYIIFTKRFHKDTKINEIFNKNKISLIMDDSDAELSTLKKITTKLLNPMEVV